MEITIILLILAAVIVAYFRNNPLNHSPAFIRRRFVNWFPLGMTYAFLYMGRYNMAVAAAALGDAMSIKDFGIIFGVGTWVYAAALLINGPLVDKMGGKTGILLAALGASIANGAMGLALYLHLHGKLSVNLTVAFAALYSVNMYFQSFGATSIIKVKAYWFHVRERGIFGAIFGTLISIGLYFAFDWGQAIVHASKVQVTGEPTWLQSLFQTLFAVNTGTVDALWLLFVVPAIILVFWALLDVWLIKDTPSQAKFEDFDTHDASSGEMHVNFTMWDLLKKVLGNRLMLVFALIEFTTGVLRNGVMQWYKKFSKDMPEIKYELISSRLGFWLCIFGIFGGFFGGIVSDKFFQSRRAPPAAMAQAVIVLCTVLMITYIFTSPMIFGIACVVISGMVITVHSLMSGTASADFGGRKATATAAGMMDSVVYWGSGLQSFAIGFLTPYDLRYWPMFLCPFAIFGLILAIKTWRELPEATKRYLVTVERVTIIEKTTIIQRSSDDVMVPGK